MAEIAGEDVAGKDLATGRPAFAFVFVR